MRRVILLILTVTAAAQAASEREIAEWALRWEGTVLLEGAQQPLTDVSQIPPGDFHIVAIDLTAGVMHPVELLKLEGLTHLRELYLPGPIWNPGAGNEDKTGVFQTLAKMKTVERLAFGWHFNAQIEVVDKDIEALFPWANLRDLRCAQCSLSKVNLSAFTKLQNLDLTYNNFTDQGMEGLAKMKNLRRLILKDTLVTDEGLKHLKDVTTLEELDLSGARVTDRGIEFLRNLKSMRRLSLQGAQTTDAAMDVLTGMEHLEALNLYRTPLTNSGLAKLQSLKHLADIDLRYTKVTPNGIEALHAALPSLRIRFVGSAAPKVKSPGAAQPADSSERAISAWVKALGGSTESVSGAITGVNLASTPVSDAQMSFLLPLRDLKKLDLRVTQIADPGLATVAKLTALEELNLSNTTVADAGLARLAGLAHLQTLRLAGTLVRGHGLESLKGLANLRELDLSGSLVDDGALPAIGAIESLVNLRLGYLRAAG
jgi:Leucine-rich repeat (LRR) protein